MPVFDNGFAPGLPVFDAGFAPGLPVIGDDFACPGPFEPPRLSSSGLEPLSPVRKGRLPAALPRLTGPFCPS